MKSIVGLVCVSLAVVSSISVAGTKFPITCQNRGGYPRIEPYLNHGRQAGFDVFKTETLVEATVSALSDAKQILSRLCAEKASLESN